MLTYQLLLPVSLLEDSNLASARPSTLACDKGSTIEIRDCSSHGYLIPMIVTYEGLCESMEAPNPAAS